MPSNSADDAMKRMEKKLQRIYAEAQKDVKKKVSDYTKKYKEQDKEKREQLKKGEITKEQYQDWKNRKVFVGNQWKQMQDSIANQLNKAGETAYKIINDERKAVFLDNANHTLYDIDKSFGFNVNFGLYDSATITRLIREDPKILPDVQGDPEKNSAWTRKRIDSAVTQGVIQGESIPDLAKRLSDKLAATSQSSMIRTARTAMTSAQNAGRIEAMKDAEDMGINVLKLWISTLDGRTRDAHRHLDGQTAEIDKPFHSNLGDIMYPADPYAVPANVWNCRCSLGWEYPEYKNQATKRIARNEDGENEYIDDMTYDQWADWVNKGKPEGTTPITPQQPTETNSDKIARMLKDGNVNIYEIGKLFAGEIHERIKGLIDPEAAERYKKELNDAEMDIGFISMKNSRKLLNDLAYDIIGHRTKNIDSSVIYSIEDGLRAIGWSNDKIKTEFTDKMANNTFTFREFQNIESQLAKGIRAKDDNIIELKEKVKNSGSLTGHRSAEVLKNELAKYRGMGAEGIDLVSHLNNSRSSMRKVVEDAYNYYPTDWVLKSVQRGNLTPKKVDRGYYSDGYREIAISDYGGSEQSFSTAVHELGHRFEMAVPTIRDEEKTFYEKRTKGERLEWLGAGYARSEVTRKDDFIHAYMGKDYHGTAYELVSMGFQYAYTEPDTLKKDEDMESWIYGLLLTQ